MNSSESIKSKLVLLFVGFILTSIIGTTIGYYFQQRTWQNQWEISNTTRVVDRKTDLFRNISSLLDQRLYRARQVLWALKEPHTVEDVEIRMNKYREVLDRWNTSINSNLALIEIDFGKALRHQFENDIARNFIQSGRVLESLYRDRQGNKSLDTSDLESDLDDLNRDVYVFNIEMLKSIQFHGRHE